MFDWNFFEGKTVLITGHTGFKGSWMCKLLVNIGAKVVGYSLAVPTQPSLFQLCGIESKVKSIIGDIRNFEHLLQVFKKEQPEIVIHMAAQPLVRDSYKRPVYTYDVNVMGTVNVLECVRQTPSVKSFLNVTTDKVYLNKEWEWGYRENEELNGYDPYSNSKSCSELITSSYISSFFNDTDVAISTARAGNVIGGGDFSANRIIPDCIRAVEQGKNIIVRNPSSIRPYQHVLEPIVAYLMITKAQYEDKGYAGNYNVGPDEVDCRTTGELVTLFCNTWNRMAGKIISWEGQYDGGPHEANFLKLDCSKIKSVLGWKAIWHVEEAIEKVVEWSLAYMKHENIKECMDRQIRNLFVDQ